MKSARSALSSKLVGSGIDGSAVRTDGDRPRALIGRAEGDRSRKQEAAPSERTEWTREWLLQHIGIGL